MDTLQLMRWMLKKNIAAAIDYFEKVLVVDPENENAKKYIAILEKDLAQQK